MGELILVRHGETQWSAVGRHTGRTDLPLTPTGSRAAEALGTVLARRAVIAAYSSPLQRATRTAQLAGLAPLTLDPDLVEWDYGGFEGLTSAEIRQRHPGWDLWRDGVVAGADGHPGETLAQVAGRADAAIARTRPRLVDGDVVVVCHGHLARVFAARWLGLDATAGRLLRHPRPAALSSLAVDDDQPTLSTWNVVPPA